MVCYLGRCAATEEQPAVAVQGANEQRVCRCRPEAAGRLCQRVVVCWGALVGGLGVLGMTAGVVGDHELRVRSAACLGGLCRPAACRGARGFRGRDMRGLL